MFSTFPNLGVFNMATAAGSGGTFSTFNMETAVWMGVIFSIFCMFAMAVGRSWIVTNRATRGFAGAFGARAGKTGRENVRLDFTSNFTSWVMCERGMLSAFFTFTF